jgi:hypothetical protein
MTTTDEQRAEIAAGIVGCVARLARARDLLSFEQRLEIAERMRDAANLLDRGRVYLPVVQQPRGPLRRLVPAHRCDHDGQPLYRLTGL